MKVYVDGVMLINFLVDFLLLLGTDRLSGFPPEWKRLISASALGAVYSGICLFPGFRFLGNPLWRTVMLGLMGSMAFGGTLLWYSVTALAYYGACSLFQGRSFLFIALLTAALSCVRYIIFGFLSTLQDIPWEPALLLDECFLQAALTPFIWLAAVSLRKGVKHEA